MDTNKEDSKETYWQCCQDGEIFISELPVLSLLLPAQFLLHIANKYSVRK